MAKLSARGRKELVRVVLERPLAREDDDLIDYEREERALMSDGKILCRRVVRFREGSRRHDYGWNVRGALKAGVNPDEWKLGYLKRGWRIV